MLISDSDTRPICDNDDSLVNNNVSFVISIELAGSNVAVVLLVVLVDPVLNVVFVVVGTTEDNSLEDIVVDWLREGSIISMEFMLFDFVVWPLAFSVNKKAER